ncbi:hypothetical protein [Blastopirellula marina]|uniref:hypothetical protein n=1 Tax=Blastopirellula marina TaxID=124 RepID=UPI00130503A1|nr:hypothetical protein [Blastopirellula marina]
MRNLMILAVAVLLMIGSSLVVSPPVAKSTQLQDHVDQIAARYHYRQRRGSIFRR